MFFVNIFMLFLLLLLLLLFCLHAVVLLFFSPVYTILLMKDAAGYFVYNVIQLHVACVMWHIACGMRQAVISIKNGDLSKCLCKRISLLWCDVTVICWCCTQENSNYESAVIHR